MLCNAKVNLIRIPELLFTSTLRFKHWESQPYKWDESATVSDRERLGFITSHYAQSAVDVAASKQEVRLTPESLMYTGKKLDDGQILRSARFIHRELPVRIAHRIMGFRELPFIIGCNPTILTVHEMYLDVFRKLTSTSSIENLQEEEEYSRMVKKILEDHTVVLGMLAGGFKECRARIKDADLIRKFLDTTLTSRLGLRILAEHHLALRENKENHVGIIDLQLSLTDVVRKQIEIVEQMCHLVYCKAPRVIITGQTNLVFPYIRTPLEYILTELFKNTFRATIESRPGGASSLPPIYVTLGSDQVDFTIRISDHAGGIPAEIENIIWDYHVSTPARPDLHFGASRNTSKARESPCLIDVLPPPTASGGAILGSHVEASSSNPDDHIELPEADEKQIRFRTSSGSNRLGSVLTEHKATSSVFGYGCGLPISRAYARYFGGDITMQTIRPIGTDCYVRLRHIDGKGQPFRI